MYGTFYFLETKYKTIDEVAKAIETKEVMGALLDAYSAGTKKEFFKQHKDIYVNRMIKYPAAYGIVLSGGMENVQAEFRDYISVFSPKILTLVEANTEKMEVCISALPRKM